MAYGGFIRRTASDKVFPDKLFAIPKKSKLDGYQSEVASVVYKFFDIYYYNHHILRPFDVYPNFQFTTNETKRGC